MNDSESNPPSTEVRQNLEQLTSTRSWDYDRFKRVMLSLAAAGNGQSVPAPNRPDSIHLQGIRSFIEGLVSRTRSTGNEHAQPVFADTGN